MIFRNVIDFVVTKAVGITIFMCKFGKGMVRFIKQVQSSLATYPQALLTVLKNIGNEFVVIVPLDEGVADRKGIGRLGGGIPDK